MRNLVEDLKYFIRVGAFAQSHDLCALESRARLISHQKETEARKEITSGVGLSLSP